MMSPCVNMAEDEAGHPTALGTEERVEQHPEAPWASRKKKVLNNYLLYRKEKSVMQMLSEKQHTTSERFSSLVSSWIFYVAWQYVFLATPLSWPTTPAVDDVS